MTTAEQMPSFAARMASLDGSGLAAILALSGSSDTVNLSGGFPETTLFPADALSTLCQEVLSNQPEVALQYAPLRGLPELRAEVADRLKADLGRDIDSGEFMITSGGIEGIELLARSFLDPGDVVAVEAPTYLGALSGFRTHGASLFEVPIDDNGLSTDHLAEALKMGLRPKLCYVIADHQNPSGALMSLERRRHLVELAARYGFYVVDDVAYRELSFDGATLPSLASLDPSVVIQVGTFSKTFNPGFRLGWLLASPRLIDQFATAKQNTDQCASAFGQLLLSSYISTGLLDETVVRARAHYGAQAHEMGLALEAHLGSSTTWIRPRGGFFYWVTFNEQVDMRALKSQAEQRGVAYVPGELFYASSRGKGSVRLSFSRVPHANIEFGIRRLAATVASSDHNE
ncbi:MAG: PLP-dependent aminotransferase family protein [Acidimicrobiales bacterium]